MSYDAATLLALKAKLAGERATIFNTKELNAMLFEVARRLLTTV